MQNAPKISSFLQKYRGGHKWTNQRIELIFICLNEIIITSRIDKILHYDWKWLKKKTKFSFRDREIHSEVVLHRKNMHFRGLHAVFSASKKVTLIVCFDG